MMFQGFIVLQPEQMQVGDFSIVMGINSFLLYTSTNSIRTSNHNLMLFFLVC